MIRLLPLLLLLGANAEAYGQVCHARLLDAIAMVETGGRPRPGKSGERGAHQMMPAAIRDNGTPERHLAWLARHLPDPTPYRLALAWNAGLTRTLEGRTLPRHHDHAQRVANLYHASTRPPQAGAPAHAPSE